MAARRSAPHNSDLRRRHRRVAVLWSGALDAPGRRQDCAILNLSAGGAKLRVGDPDACPARISIENPRFGRLDGRVVWRRDDLLGMAFVEPAQAVQPALAVALNVAS